MAKKKGLVGLTILGIIRRIPAAQVVQPNPMPKGLMRARAAHIHAVPLASGQPGLLVTTRCGHHVLIAVLTLK